MKTLTNFVRVLEQVKTLNSILDFNDLLSNSDKNSSRFSFGYEDTENVLYFWTAR